jgi:hypothetical protein
LGKELLRIAVIAVIGGTKTKTHSKTFNAEEKRKLRNWRNGKRKTVGMGQQRRNL